MVSCNTTVELWSTLLKTFSSSSRAHLTELQRQLQTVSKGNSSCSEYLQKIRRVADELAFAGSPISDEDLVLAVLNGLGMDYNSFVVAVNSHENPITFADLYGLLLAMKLFFKNKHLLPYPLSPCPPLILRVQVVITLSARVTVLHTQTDSITNVDFDPLTWIQTRITLG